MSDHHTSIIPPAFKRVGVAFGTGHCAVSRSCMPQMTSATASTSSCTSCPDTGVRCMLSALAVLQFATEAALTILRIDDLIKLDAPEPEGDE